MYARADGVGDLVMSQGCIFYSNPESGELYQDPGTPCLDSGVDPFQALLDAATAARNSRTLQALFSPSGAQAANVNQDAETASGLLKLIPVHSPLPNMNAPSWLKAALIAGGVLAGILILKR